MVLLLTMLLLTMMIFIADDAFKLFILPDVVVVVVVVVLFYFLSSLFSLCLSVSLSLSVCLYIYLSSLSSLFSLFIYFPPFSAHYDLESALIFEIQSEMRIRTYCGVLEFVAPERSVVLPNWVTLNISGCVTNSNVLNEHKGFISVINSEPAMKDECNNKYLSDK